MADTRPAWRNLSDDLAFRVAEVTAEHHLDESETNADGDNPCACGVYVDGWDFHWAEITLDALDALGYQITPKETPHG